MKFLATLLLCFSAQAGAAKWQSMPISVWQSNGPQILASAIRNAETQWSQASSGAIEFKKAPGQIVVIWETFPSVSFGNQAITIVSNWRADTINQAVIFINASGIYGKLTARKLKAIVLHEFGHCFGIGHNAQMSVMNPGVVQMFWPVTLFSADVALIQSLY